MRRVKVYCVILFGVLPLWRLEAHGYRFANTNEEMKDHIFIQMDPQQITVQYQSEYLGQIAPHIRLMMDRNSDSELTDDEVKLFFEAYKTVVNTTLLNVPLNIGSNLSTLELVDVLAPSILNDSLLASFTIQMVFKIDRPKFVLGSNELIIDPKLFFIAGDQFIMMAKERADFTEQQEQEIGRFLQIQIMASDSIVFTSTFPGYIKKNKRLISIYGVFYDETILRIKNSQYPKLRIGFNLL